MRCLSGAEIQRIAGFNAMATTMVHVRVDEKVSFLNKVLPPRRSLFSLAQRAEMGI
jgi:hypothetical protein